MAHAARCLSCRGPGRARLWAGDGCQGYKLCGFLTETAEALARGVGGWGEGEAEAAAGSQQSPSTANAHYDPGAHGPRNRKPEFGIRQTLIGPRIRHCPSGTRKQGDRSDAAFGSDTSKRTRASEPYDLALSTPDTSCWSNAVARFASQPAEDGGGGDPELVGGFAHGEPFAGGRFGRRLGAKDV
jgi:hypothetical protein